MKTMYIASPSNNKTNQCCKQIYEYMNAQRLSVARAKTDSKGKNFKTIFYDLFFWFL